MNVRLNYDFSVTPTKTIASRRRPSKSIFSNHTPWQDFDQQTELGMAQPAGADTNLFPSIRGLSSNFGGLNIGLFGIGPPNQAR